MTYRTAFIDPDFAASHNSISLGSCAIAAASRIKEGSKYRVVHVNSNDYLGMVAVHPEDEHLSPQSDDWMPVGLDCAKKIGMEFTHGPDAWNRTKSEAKPEVPHDRHRHPTPSTRLCDRPHLSARQHQNATVILKRVGGEYADVCFAGDWRQEMFPVALSRLHPFHPAGVLQ